MSNIKTSNEHFLIRNRNIRNEYLKKTDYFMLSDVYEVLTLEQQQELITYRKTLRDFINQNESNYLDKGINFIDFPNPPSWMNIPLIKY